MTFIRLVLVNRVCFKRVRQKTGSVENDFNTFSY